MAAITVTIPRIVNSMVSSSAAIAWSKISKVGAALSDFSGSVSTSQLPTGIDAANLADGSVSNTEFQYLGSVTSNIQTQLDAAVGGSGSDPWIYKRVSSDFTRSDQTPTLVTGLSFTPAADKTYIVHGMLILQTANSTIAACQGVTWPTGLTSGVVTLRQASSTASTELLQHGDTTASVTFTTGGYSAANVDRYALIDATFVTGATPSGDFTVTLRNEGGSVVVTVKAGSWIAYRTIN